MIIPQIDDYICIETVDILSFMLEDLIKEGKDIRGSITNLDPPEGVMRLYSAYRNPDTQKYGAWKNRSIRYLDRTSPHDRCVRDFEAAIESFEKNHNNPSKLDDAIGVLISCRDFKPGIDAAPDSEETAIKKVLNLEAEYERSVSGKDSENKREAISAFHNWYDAFCGLIVKYCRQNAKFKNKILYYCLFLIIFAVPTENRQP